MNVKKHITAVLAIFISICAFAYPAVQEDDQTAQLLQQYTQQAEELQKGFEQKLLPACKGIATLALEVQAAGQSDLTAEQNTLLENYTNTLEKNLTELLAPVLKDFNLAKFNEQYAQIAQASGLPAQELTLQDVTNMFKGMYLLGALGYFEQSQKLSDDEITVLAEIFFSLDEEAEAAQ